MITPKLTETSLRSLLHVYLTDKGRLSTQEVELATMIRHCSRCNRFWLGHGKNPPRRCHHCRRRRYDTPLLDAIAAAEGNLAPPEVIAQLPPKPEESTD